MKQFRLTMMFAASALTFAACATADDPTEDPEANDVDPPATDVELVVTPTGLVHASCVQEIGQGDEINDDGLVTRPDGTTYQLPACEHDTMPIRGEVQRKQAELDTGTSVLAEEGAVPTDNGWIEAAWWHSPHWMKHLAGNFVVPPAPTNKSSQTIFFFPSFEPAAGTSIIQPVLQWGPSAAGGGKYWAIASWYVGPKRTVHGPLKRVSVGDQLGGTIAGSACTSGGKCTWTITTHDSTHAATSTIKLTTGEVFTEVQGGVLEAYNVNACNKYPPNGVEAFFNLKFTNGAGNAVSPSFQKMFWHKTCGESQVDSSKLVFLNWN
jgi:hypothetical protein